MYMYMARLHVRAHLLPAGLHAGCAVRVRGCRLCVAYLIEYISIAWLLRRIAWLLRRIA